MILNKKGLQQLRQGHPWLWEDMVDGKNWPTQPCLVPIGEHWFFYSPKSKLRFRRLGPSQRMWPSENLERKIISEPSDFVKHFGDALTDYLASITKSQSLLVQGDRCFRWIFAENQGLPGLVLDIFNSTVVAQIQSAPIEWIWPELKSIFENAWQRVFPGDSPLVWLEDRSSNLRKLEGLEILENKHEDLLLKIKWNGFNWEFRPGSSQKTGAYLDQRINHRRATEWAKTMNLKSAWDLCCYEGGFGIHLAAFGLPVLFLDQSEKALEATKRNLALNSLDESKHQFVKADIFDFLKDRGQQAPKSVDAIILDPPSFTRSKQDKVRALRGYFELHRQALKCLAPNGLLVSCSCSHHITRADLEECIREASHQTRRDLRIIDVGSQAPDHGRSIGFPESEYLHTIFLTAN